MMTGIARIMLPMRAILKYVTKLSNGSRKTRRKSWLRSSAGCFKKRRRSSVNAAEIARPITTATEQMISLRRSSWRCSTSVK